MDVPSAANLQIGKGESLKIAWFLAIHVPQATKRGIEHTLSSGASYRHLCHAYSTSYPSHFYRILIRRNVSFHRLMLKGHVRNTWCTDSSLSLHSEHHRGPISPLLKSKNYIYWKKKGYLLIHSNGSRISSLSILLGNKIKSPWQTMQTLFKKTIKKH